MWYIMCRLRKLLKQVDTGITRVYAVDMNKQIAIIFGATVALLIGCIFILSYVSYAQGAASIEPTTKTITVTATPEPAPTVTVTATPEPAPTATPTESPNMCDTDDWYMDPYCMDLYEKMEKK